MKTSSDELPSIVDSKYFEDLFHLIYKLKCEDDERITLAFRCGKKPRRSSIQDHWDFVVRELNKKLASEIQKIINEREQGKNEKEKDEQ